MSNKSLYERLGGYDAIAAVSNDLVRLCHIIEFPKESGSDLN